MIETAYISNLGNDVAARQPLIWLTKAIPQTAFRTPGTNANRTSRPSVRHQGQTNEPDERFTADDDHEKNRLSEAASTIVDACVSQDMSNRTESQ